MIIVGAFVGLGDGFPAFMTIFAVCCGIAIVATGSLYFVMRWVDRGE